jgi:hypothetical protein
MKLTGELPPDPGSLQQRPHRPLSRSDVHESDLLLEPEFFGLEDLSTDVKGGGVYPTNQLLIFAEPLFICRIWL